MFHHSIKYNQLAYLMMHIFLRCYYEFFLSILEMKYAQNLASRGFPIIFRATLGQKLQKNPGSIFLVLVKGDCNWIYKSIKLYTYIFVCKHMC